MKGVRYGGKPWTAAETDKLIRLKQQRARWPGIVAQFPGRTYQACVNRWHDLCRRSGVRTTPAHSSRDERHRRRVAVRQAAMQQAHDLTAQLMGDPPPGRSALDRRGDDSLVRISLAGARP